MDSLRSPTVGGSFVDSTGREREGGGYCGPSYGGLRQFEREGATNLTVLHTWDREEADDEAFVQPIRDAGGVWFPGGRQWRLADVYLDTPTEEELWRLLERGGVIGGTSAGATIQGSYLARGDTRTNTIMIGDHEEGFALDDANGGRFYFLAPGDVFDLATRTGYRPGRRAARDRADRAELLVRPRIAPDRARALRQERELLERFGADYEAYRRRSGALVPPLPGTLRGPP